MKHLADEFRRADPRLMPHALLRAYCAWRFGWKPDRVKRSVGEVLWR